MMSFSKQRYVLVVLRFNGTSTLVGHFVSLFRDSEKRDRRDRREDDRDSGEREK